jgi:hypothetical protein
VNNLPLGALEMRLIQTRSTRKLPRRQDPSSNVRLA